MNKLFLFSIIFITLFSCNTKKDTKAIFANKEAIKLSEKEEFYNLQKRDPSTKKIPQNIHIDEYNFVSKIAKSNSNISWYARGPHNVGGRTRALAIDINNSNRIIVGGVSGGLWISENLGESYVKSTSSQQFHSVTCLAQDKSFGNNNIWYYGTGEQNGNSSDLKGNGIFKSIDNGLTWSILEATVNDSSKIVSTLGDFAWVKDIKVNPINGDVVVATFAGIFISKNGGNTWQNVLVGGASPNGFGYVNFGKQTNIDVSDNGVYYATLSKDCVNDGIWTSNDGINWLEITPSGFASTYRRIESGISPSDPDQVFFVVDASSSPFNDIHQLWKYNVATNQWIDKTANLPAGTCTGFYTFDFGYFQTQNSYDMLISVHPTDTNIIFLGGTNLYRSTDGFSSPAYDWIGGYYCDSSNPANYVFPNHHPDNHALAFVPNTDILISAHDGGLSKTQNCLANNIEWQYINDGYSTSQFYTVAIEPGETDNDVIMGGLQDNGTFYTNSLNSKQDWMFTFYGDGAYCAITENRENYYISWQLGKTFKANIDDYGNIENISRIDPSGASSFAFINSFILDPSNSDRMYLAGGSRIWRNDSLDYIPVLNEEYVTNNLGWEQITNSYVSGSYARISTLDMSKNSTNVLYYGSSNGRLYRLEGLDDKSYVKTDIKESPMPYSAYISCVEIDNEDENKVFVTFSNYNVKSIFYSEDAGTNWQDVSGNLEEFENGSGAGPSVNWIHIAKKDGNKIYLVGTTSGLFSTEVLDGVNTVWYREAAEEIGNVPVSMITSREFDNNIVIATHGNGVFSTKEFVSSIKEISAKERSFYLSNVQANPVKDKMKFTYRIDKNSFVKISITDIMGKEIDILQNGKQIAGTYEKRWFKSKDISKAYYYLLVEVNGYILSRKFLIE